MNGESFHLNLMKSGEVRSSSPVRLRVMMPLLAMLATIGLVVWWGSSLAQSIIISAQIKTIEADIDAKRKDHSEVMEQQGLVRELRLQIEQLEYYGNGVRAVGEPLAKLAEVTPVRIQMTELSISPLPPQNLNPPGKKGPPLWGPTTNVETQKLVIAGRATRETPVQAMMESLDADEFAGLVTKARKVNSFRQDSSQSKDGRRLLAFEVEYTMPERRFSK